MDIQNVKIMYYSIIIPIKNEDDNIVILLSKLNKQYNQLYPYTNFEIIFADDSDDFYNTLLILTNAWKGLNSALNIRAVNCENKGLGAAVRLASFSARTDAILVMDGDLSHNPSDVPELAFNFFDNPVEIVIGSRYIPGGGFTKDWNWKRVLISKLFAKLAYPITKIHDSTSGFFITKKSIIQATTENGYKIMLDSVLTEKMRWLNLQFDWVTSDRIIEIPIIFRDRFKGESKASLKEGIIFIKRLMQLYRTAIFGY